MRDVALFGEDFAHEKIIGALVRRLANEAGVRVRLDWRNATGGHGRVVQELRTYLRDLRNQVDRRPDLIVVATDANCKGLNDREREVQQEAPAKMVLAIPDPHVERWLLLDGAAFKAVFGRGCDAPDLKCDRDRYKERLIRAIYETDMTPSLGGIEFAEDIVEHMDLDRVARADESFRRFVGNLRGSLQA
ncbi:MAG: DUF4276 family protein [Rhodospirillales bacterium]